MHSSRFDAWTRRRLGLATSGAVAAALGLAADAEPAAGRKRKRGKRKKRCKRFGAGCQPGRKRTCCRGLACDEVSGASGFSCCKKLRARCAGDVECCGDLLCEPFNCCKRNGQPCASSQECCSVLGCKIEVGSDVGTCGSP